MARNDEGEFELVLGNRQLISVFLIVVILLAVLFSMGYIVGRNSTAVVAEAPRPTAEKAAKPIVIERATDSAAPPKQESPGLTEPPKPKPTGAGPAAKTLEKPTPAAAATPPPVKETKPQVSTPSAPASATSEPPAGQYWQVVATSRPDAEIISEALGKKGFHSIVAPGPRDTIFRVLVGPFKDAATVAQGRADLEASGFKNPIMRKY